MTLSVRAVPLLADNYAWILRDGADGAVALVDPGEAGPALDALDERLDAILLTHHHADHVDGVEAVRRRFPEAALIGAAADAHRLPKLDRAVADGDTVRVGETDLLVIDTPGHTRGHIAFYAADGGVLLCGDTLFGIGCGRLLEGSPAEMFGSLRRLSVLPPDTLVCCGHEYTESNLRFALHEDPDNDALRTHGEQVAQLRRQHRPSVPSRLGTELALNPFLRANDVEQLGRMRARKDDFRG